MSDRFDRAVVAQGLERAERYHGRMWGKDDGTTAGDYLQARGISTEMVRKYKLGVSDDIYAGRITIPYLRRAGAIGFKYRAVNGEQPKYLTSGNTHLYNVDALEQADLTGEIFICEGEFDAIIATERYNMPAVGVPGATQWVGHKHWRELFRGYSKIWILADPDEAGLSLAEEITRTLPIAKTVALPYDVTDCWINSIEILEHVK